jgi:hypothetical protein
MSICTVNGSERRTESGLETWGQLLAALEQGDGPKRPVVTAVRFAGVDQPTFRDPALLALNLSAAAPVDVDAAASGELVASAKQTALDSLGTLTTAARSTAKAFRLHDLPRAHRGLADFVIAFRLLTALTAVIGSAAGEAEGGDLEAQGAELLERLRAGLESLLAFNGNEDWISVADVLEYEIAETLPQWSRVLSDAGRNAS